MIFATAIIFDSADAANLSELLEERARLHLAAKALIRTIRKSAECPDCRGCERSVSWELCQVVPCATCRPAAFVEFMANVGKCGNCGAFPGQSGCQVCHYVGCDEPPTDDEPCPDTERSI